jgi:SAM-dependent methyltransferase
MRLMPDDLGALTTCPEQAVYERLLPLDGARILELGCGTAQLTRRIALGGADRTILALEVDEIQHGLNLRIADLPNVEFRLAGAEAIPAADASFDIVLLFKSLHHVPLDQMATAMREIRRVLKPGGLAYISEPVFAGAFNDILRLFHNEERVRAAAFEAVRASVDSGDFELGEEVFFNTPVHYADFAEFERTVIGVTHTRHHLSEATHAEVRRRFEALQGLEGVDFATPIRVDLLRRGASLAR